MAKYLGLDLGGTNIKVAVIEKKNTHWQVIKKDDQPTEAAGGPTHVAERLAQLARDNLNEFQDLSGVGVAVPGIFDSSAGTILLFPNLPGPWKDFQILNPIANATNLPTVLINDSRAFTLAETIMGAAQGKKTVVCYVIGTGVGGGVVLDGKIHLGSTGSAGEIAHQILKPDGLTCGCGSKGCAETLTNSAAIAKVAGTQTSEEAYIKAVAGDPQALAAFKEVGYWISIALTNVMVILAPDAIIIGGGVAQSGDILLNEIRSQMALRSNIYPESAINIVPATLGFHAGAIGAALHGATKAGEQLNLMS